MSFSFANPDYSEVRRARIAALLQYRRATPSEQAAMHQWWALHPEDFLWFGDTRDPRNPARGLPADVPLLPMPRQREMIACVVQHWRDGKPLLIEKSRDCGASVCMVTSFLTLLMFNRGLTIGLGSRKEMLLDNGADPNSLCQIGRMWLESLPSDLCPRWTSSHMKIVFPDTQSALIAEAGNQIGRGARTSIYLVDESAFVEDAESIEASLSATTNCRIDLSSVAGLSNPFARKRFSGNVDVFTFHWTSDLRKDAQWYAQKCRELPPSVIASELDLDYTGAQERQLIPALWITSAINAHGRLGISPTGRKYGALDVADEGKDKNCFAMRHGIVLQFLKTWSGKGSDIYKTTAQALTLCDELEVEEFYFDQDGIGSACRGDSEKINEARQAERKRQIHARPFRGSGAVPDGELVKSRQNKDFFSNLKAMSFWSLRIRFERTYQAVVQKKPVDVDSIISINPDLPELLQLRMELSQPTWSRTQTGKVLVDKMPNGMASPNRADAVMICYSPSTNAYALWAKLAT